MSCKSNLIADVQVNVEVVTEEVKQEVDKEVVVESQKEAPEVEKSDVKEEDVSFNISTSILLVGFSLLVDFRKQLI